MESANDSPSISPPVFLTAFTRPAKIRTVSVWREILSQPRSATRRRLRRPWHARQSHLQRHDSARPLTLFLRVRRACAGSTAATTPAMCYKRQKQSNDRTYRAAGARAASASTSTSSARTARRAEAAQAHGSHRQGRRARVEMESSPFGTNRKIALARRRKGVATLRVVRRYRTILISTLLKTSDDSATARSGNSP